MTGVAALTTDTHVALASARRALAEEHGRILEMQVAIARIPSPTFGETRRGDWIGDQLARAGWQVRTDAAGNVIAGTASSRPAIAVCAHLDTVYADGAAPEPVRRGARIEGPGICDNGRGLAALVALARAIPAELRSAAGGIELVATTGEEGVGDLRGAKHYVASRAPAALIALDGAGDDRVVNTALGSRRFRIAFAGPGGHSWAAYGVANPVHAAARCASALANLSRKPGTSLTVSRIGGGVSVNAIPDDAWLEVDVRGFSESALSALESEVRRATLRALREENERRTGGDALRHVIERIGLRACGHTPERAALVQVAMAATELVGRAPALASASTDANAAIAEGIPAIAIGGGGRGGDVHSSAEWFDATDAGIGLERALTIVATVARIGAPA
ncbi:MAG TPA: M20/M25/M40 family metallo-hydrolase [Gemmatimonadaceae bacterium]|nr:M20/M25/M40 family metallo-hydrolase [Gemmatimonadaceae bacterium]